MKYRLRYIDNRMRKQFSNSERKAPNTSYYSDIWAR